MDSLYNKALNKLFFNDVEIVEHEHQKSLNKKIKQKESESQNYFFYDNESHREKETQTLKEKWNAIDVSKKQTLNEYVQLLIKQRKNENLH